MASADLFVVCKNCRSEVSPYITECPYCGARLRKRAPKIERVDRPQPAAARATAPPRLERLRRGEIPGIRGDARPYATLVLLAASVLLPLVSVIAPLTLASLATGAALPDQPWRLATAPFVYDGTGYALVALSALALFGWLLERRHGPLVVLAVALGAGIGGLAVVDLLEPRTVGFGGNGMALGVLCAWAVPDLLARRRGEETDSDGLGVAAFVLALLLLPFAIAEANPLAGLVGGLFGLLAGAVLTRLRPQR